MRVPKAIRQTPWIAPLIVIGLGLAQNSERGATSRSPVSDVEPASEEAPQIAGAAEIWARPSDYVGQLLSLEVQLESELESWNPLMTRFGPGDYRGYKAWSEQQLLWIAENYRAPIARVFARRGGPAERALQSAGRFDRFKLLCRVQSGFAGLPWIEVLAVTPRPRRMQAGSVNHAVRGMDLAKKQLWKAAAGEFERAASPGIPRLAHAELMRLAQLCTKQVPRTLGERVTSW